MPERKGPTPERMALRAPLTDWERSRAMGTILKFFQVPSDYDIAKFEYANSQKVTYVPPAVPDNPVLARSLMDATIDNGLSSRADDVVRQSMLLPLLAQLKNDFGGRRIALQGITTTTSEKIEIPASKTRLGKRKKAIRSPLGLVDPMPTSRYPIPLIEIVQDLKQIPLVFHFMVNDARIVREEVDELYKDAIFPALRVFDPAYISRSTGGRLGPIAYQERYIRLPKDKAARQASVLGVYVLPFPIIRQKKIKKNV